MKRQIPEILERIYRLRHHDFAGLDSKAVAKMLGITQHYVNRCMRKLEKIAPQLFPILTKRQMDVYVLRECLGMTHPEIEQYLGMKPGTSPATCFYIRKKGMYMQPDVLHRVDTYSTWMDYKVTRKF